jgi:lysophospholipase L1-like esterase
MDVATLGEATRQAKADAARKYLSQAAADGRYMSGALAPLYGFQSKLSIASAQRCDVLMVGDSIMEGFGSPTPSDRWTTLAQGLLRSRFAVGTQGPGFYPASFISNDGTTAWADRWIYTGDRGAAGTGLGFKGIQLRINGTTGNGSGTLTKTCTSFKLYATRQAADAISIVIDGGAPLTWTLATTGAVQQSWTSPALTAGSHTVVITATAGGPIFSGGYFFNGDEAAGVALWDLSHSGAKMSDYVTNADWYGFLPGINPALIVLGCLTNDCRTSSGGYSAATYKTNTTSVVAGIRAKLPNAPILFMPPYKPLGTLIEPWDNYLSALRQVVATTAYSALYDMSARIPDLTTDAYSFLTDGVHPTARGHAMLARLSLAALEPR